MSECGCCIGSVCHDCHDKLYDKKKDLETKLQIAVEALGDIKKELLDTNEDITFRIENVNYLDIDGIREDISYSITRAKEALEKIGGIYG